MGGLGSSVPGPPRWRAWLIRAGLAKAEPRELPWLIAELDRAEVDRGTRRGWVLAVQVPACAALVALGFAIRDGHAGLLGYAASYTVFVVTLGLVAPRWTFNRRRTSLLRLHGRNSLGGADASPTRFSRLDPVAYSLLQATIVVGGIGVIALGVHALSRPPTVDIVECLRSPDHVAVFAEVTGGGPLADAPVVRVVDASTGDLLATLRLTHDGYQAVQATLEGGAGPTAPGSGAVTCHVAG
jgi:hypothetical protein